MSALTIQNDRPIHEDYLPSIVLNACGVGAAAELPAVRSWLGFGRRIGVVRPHDPLNQRMAHNVFLAEVHELNALDIRNHAFELQSTRRFFLPAGQSE